MYTTWKLLFSVEHFTPFTKGLLNRRNVSAARKDLRQKEVIVRAQALDKTLQDKADKYAQLERLVEQIQHKVRILYISY